eukprot:scaffold374_cov271-Pinguiococcus_pyrenoidosus.AAC.22
MHPVLQGDAPSFGAEAASVYARSGGPVEIVPGHLLSARLRRSLTYGTRHQWYATVDGAYVLPRDPAEFRALQLPALWRRPLGT